MLTTNDLSFQHFIESTSDGLVFACARDHGKIRNFLINRYADVVLEQTAYNGFIRAGADVAGIVLDSFKSGRAVLYKTYKIALN